MKRTTEPEKPELSIGMATHVVPQTQLVAGRWILKESMLRAVRIMSIAEGYAMVRCKGCAPYVARVSELAQPRKKDGQHVR